ncbi:hypothetical protein GQF42_29205 [Streptomyces broussonetiae]|uniref:Uncharacterized protein n=1 Tax=Streptomyces broussonetiae TaxID=2686304 RepID=A0A6I6N0Z6_9ACTN|nr:hypothetical protein [Streptomyces broussonetiae]QHA06828.1 hypothetical protein GQF42_29205 [Streptomyces broussonetiae]
MKSAPLAAVDVWLPVMETAGYRCQCTGECGNPHAKTEGRCPREHDGYTSKRGHRIRLMAAPADLRVSPVKAVTLPPGELRAWCPDCHAATARLARKRLPAAPDDQCGLFDL